MAAADRIAVLGAGQMGNGIAHVFAQCGYPVTMIDISADALSTARATIASNLDRQIKKGTLAATEKDAVLTRISTHTALDAVGDATLVVEAVAEQPEVKRAILDALGPHLSAAAILASTTSSLNIAELARISGMPERFFGFHVFNPVPRMELVELCFPDEAAPDTRERARAFCAALDKTAVEVPDEPGFVVNRLLFPYLFDAVRLLERSGLEPEQVDACMKLGASHPMGPLELLDFVGIDVADAIGEALYADTGDPTHRPPGRIKQLVGEGRLGRKSGRGFYGYD
jgi:3-hydroxybutyryl-CoA dehydrogenase